MILTGKAKEDFGKTPEDYLNEVARSYAYNSFSNYCDCQHNTKSGRNKIEEIAIEAMNRYAADKCKEQREICADEAKTDEKADKYGDIDYWVDKDSILNAPLATDKQ